MWRARIAGSVALICDCQVISSDRAKGWASWPAQNEFLFVGKKNFSLYSPKDLALSGMSQSL